MNIETILTHRDILPLVKKSHRYMVFYLFIGGQYNFIYFDTLKSAEEEARNISRCFKNTAIFISQLLHEWIFNDNLCKNVYGRFNDKHHTYIVSDVSSKTKKQIFTFFGCFDSADESAKSMARHSPNTSFYVSCFCCVLNNDLLKEKDIWDRNGFCRL